MSIFGIDPIGAAVSFYNLIESLVTGSREEKAALAELLEESNKNLKIIKDEYMSNDMPVARVLDALKIKKLNKAEELRQRKKLNFNKITPNKRVKKDCINKLPNNLKENYSEFETEQLFLKIINKIT